MVSRGDPEHIWLQSKCWGVKTFSTLPNTGEGEPCTAKRERAKGDEKQLPKRGFLAIDHILDNLMPLNVLNTGVTWKFLVEMKIAQYKGLWWFGCVSFCLFFFFF